MSSSRLSDLGEWHVSWVLWRTPSAKLRLGLGAIYAGTWHLRQPRCLTFSWVNVGLWLLPSCTFTWTVAVDVRGGSPKSFAPTSSVNRGADYVWEGKEQSSPSNTEKGSINKVIIHYSNFNSKLSHRGFSTTNRNPKSGVQDRERISFFLNNKIHITS